jgi:hypothetical protein
LGRFGQCPGAVAARADPVAAEFHQRIAANDILGGNRKRG